MANGFRDPADSVPASNSPAIRDVDIDRVRAVLTIGGVPWHALDDCLQQVRVKLFESDAGFRSGGPVSNVSAWSAVVATTVAMDWHRAHRRSTDLSDRLAREWADHHQEPEDAEFVLCIAEALESLADIHRQVVILRYFQDMTVPQIAAALDIREGTVKSRLHTATRSLKVRIPDVKGER